MSKPAPGATSAGEVPGAARFRIIATSAGDLGGRIGQSIDFCQEEFAKDHRDIYAGEYPELTNEHWSSKLSCGDVAKFLAGGVGLLRAEEIATQRVAGYISWWTEPPRVSVAKTDGVLSERPHREVKHIAVLPEFRGHGVGRMLMQALRDGMAEGSHANSGSLLPADSLELVVLEQNVRALRWYHRLGFRVCGLCVKPLIQGERQMVAYIHMMWCREGGKPPRRFFDDELVGERLRLVSEVGDHQDGAPVVTVATYNEESGVHKLSDGRQEDLSVAFAEGRTSFVRPLHSVLAHWYERRLAAEELRRTAAAAASTDSPLGSLPAPGPVTPQRSSRRSLSRLESFSSLGASPGLPRRYSLRPRKQAPAEPAEPSPPRRAPDPTRPRIGRPPAQPAPAQRTAPKRGRPAKLARAPPPAAAPAWPPPWWPVQPADGRGRRPAAASRAKAMAPLVGREPGPPVKRIRRLIVR